MLYNEPPILPLKVCVEKYVHDKEVGKITNLSLDRREESKLLMSKGGKGEPGEGKNQTQRQRKKRREGQDRRVKMKTYNIEWPNKVTNEGLKYLVYEWKGLTIFDSVQNQEAGRGVKAKKDLKRGECFPIMGQFRNGAFTDGERSHLWKLGMNREGEMLWVDGRPRASPGGLNMVMMVNEPGDKGREETGAVALPNAMLMNLVLMVIRDIKQGEEILVYYGRGYNEVRTQRGYPFSAKTMKQMEEWQGEVEMEDWFGKAKESLRRDKEKIKKEAREMMEEAQRGFKVVGTDIEEETELQLEQNPEDAFENMSEAFTLRNLDAGRSDGLDERQLEKLDDFFEVVLGSETAESRKSEYAWWVKQYAGRIEGRNRVMEERGGKVEIFHLMETRMQTAMEDEDAKIFFDECPIEIRHILQSMLKWVRTEFELGQDRGLYLVAMRTPPGAAPQEWHLDSLKRTNAWIVPLGPPGTPFTEFKNYPVPKRPGLKSTKQEVGEWMRITQEGRRAGTTANTTRKRGEAMLINPLVWHRGPAWGEEEKRGRNTIFVEWGVTEVPDIINAKWNEGEEDDDDLFEPNVAQQVFTLKPWLRECIDVREDGGEKVEQKEKKREGRTRIPKKKDITLRPALGLGGVK